MAKTIDQLPILSALPSDSAIFPISDNGVTKRVAAGVLKSDCLRVLANVVTVPEATNISVGTTTGTKLGTAANQKIGFWGATAVAQPALTTDLLDSLQQVGLVASGAGNTPLNLTQGAVTCGTITSDDQTFRDGKNIVVGTVNGTKICSATNQRLGFWGKTPVVQPTALGNIAVTITTGTLPAPTAAFTIANAGSPTNAELLRYCVELEYRIETLLQKLRDIGLIAT